LARRKGPKMRAIDNKKREGKRAKAQFNVSGAEKKPSK